MAWSSPSTRTTGTLITAAIWNQDVVDNPIDLDTRNSSVSSLVQANPVINGGFDVWQRGTSFAAISNGDYFADRWKVFKSGSMVYTVTRSAGSPNSSTYATAGIPYAPASYKAKFDCTTADASIGASDIMIIAHQMEGYEWARLHRRAFTVSFWWYATKAGTYCFSVRNNPTTTSYVAEFTATASTWEYHTINVPAETSETWELENGIGAKFGWAIAAGADSQGTAGSWQASSITATSNQVNGCDSTSNDTYISQVKISPQDSYIDYAIPSYQEELRRCLRYYWRVKNADAYVGGSDGSPIFALGQVQSGDNTKVDFIVYSPVGMRSSTPTISGSVTSTVGASGNSTSIVVSSGSGTGSPQPHLDEESRTMWALTATMDGSGTAAAVAALKLRSSADFIMDAEL